MTTNPVIDTRYKAHGMVSASVGVELEGREGLPADSNSFSNDIHASLPLAGDTSTDLPLHLLHTTTTALPMAQTAGRKASGQQQLTAKMCPAKGVK